VGGKGVMEGNGRCWMDQCKVYPQWVYIHWDTSLNINLNNDNEKQDCKIGKIWGGYTIGRRVGEWRRLRWGYIVDGLHIPIWNKTEK
jgi:hypothetical protein